MSNNISDAYSDEQIMLTLAAISYRAFNLTVLSEAAKQTHLFRAMEDCLDTLGPVKNEWKIAWGPVGFDSKVIGIDDSAMYVAENVKKPILAVAVRGTNPISWFDWVFGDLAAYKTVPWPYGKEAAGAEISFSTALGLGILQHLRDNSSVSQQPTSSTGSTIFGKLGDALKAVAGEARKLVRGSSELPSLEDWVSSIEQRRIRQAGDALFGALDEHLNGLFSQHPDPLALIAIAIEKHAASAPGVDLRGFLADKVKSKHYDIYVTGHSKGAALSTTVALWLADTQGGAPVSQEDQWDVNRNATVYAYSFAGPTAGNGKFASHSNSVIGDRCWRVANKKDIVPHAWNDLAAIPGLYDSPEPEQKLLHELYDWVAPKVAQLDYQQVGNADKVHEFTGSVVPGMPFLGQAIHQHVTAYFKEMHLDSEMHLGTFFTPVP